MIRRRWIGYVPLLALLLAAAWGLRRDRDLIVAWRALRPSPVLAEPALRGASLGPATYQGRLQDPRLREASGIAASRLRDERFWLINDSGEARLFAVGPDGRHLGTVALDRSLRGDWEDLASFRWRGSAYLVIADVGDNLSARRERRLIFVAEPPEEEPSGAVQPAWVLRFRFEDGPRDCEALAIDPIAQRVLLLEKRARPAGVYALPLRPATSGSAPLTARRIAQIATLPFVVESDRADYTWLQRRWFGMPTALDISADGQVAAVLTVKDAYLFHRRGQQTWAEAFSALPEVIELPPLAQAEALAFSRDGSALFVTSEERPAPLFRMDRQSDAS